ncbi:hypothetical protein OGATHE_002364, partial [Ogataea polymorpha]
KFPGSPTIRTPGSPTIQSRQTSIVEMLSTPPPIEHLELGSIDSSISTPGSPGSHGSNLYHLQPQSSIQSSLSRNASMSSSNSTFM